MAKVQVGNASDVQLKNYNNTTTKANINASVSVPELRTQVAILADMVNALTIQVQELKKTEIS